MKFSDFSKTELKNNANVEPTKEAEQKIKNVYNKYSNLNEEELMSEFLRVSQEQRASGSLDDKKIGKICETLTPYLSDEQKDYLNKLIKKM